VRQIRKDFLKDSAGLQRRFWLTGAGCLVLMPFVLVFMTVHFFLKHAQEWRAKKNYFGPRQWVRRKRERYCGSARARVIAEAAVQRKALSVIASTSLPRSSFFLVWVF
jgi:hypothetical protein